MSYYRSVLYLTSDIHNLRDRKMPGVERLLRGVLQFQQTERATLLRKLRALKSNPAVSIADFSFYLLTIYIFNYFYYVTHVIQISIIFNISLVGLLM